MTQGQKYIAVRMNSTTGQFVVEATTANRLRESKADYCGPWSSKAKAQQACDILNAATDSEEPILADELLAEHGL